MRGAGVAVLLAVVALGSSASAATTRHHPRAFSLSGAAWATVVRRTTVYALPSASARVVAVRDPTVAGSTGWVRRHDLSAVRTVDTHLYPDRRTLTLTLKREGVTIFAARVGIGERYWPAPAGQYFVRGKEAGFDNPFYGPLVIETSACSTILLEWPDGPCMVGIQGTNEPQILPGRVSHGEIRMPNRDILRLAPLVPIGTPLTVS